MKNILILFLLFVAYTGFSQAPDITLISTNNTEYNLYTELKAEKVVVLDFFSVNCVYCQVNTPTLDSIYSNRLNRGEYGWVWGVETTDQTDSAVDAFMNEYGGTFPAFSLINNDSIINEKYGYDVPYTPYYYVITPDTRMRQVSLDKINDILDEYDVGLPSSNIRNNQIKIIPRHNYLQFKNIQYCGQQINIQIYNLRGEKLITKNLQDKEPIIYLPPNAGQMLLVRIISNNRAIHSEKIIFHK